MSKVQVYIPSKVPRALPCNGGTGLNSQLMLPMRYAMGVANGHGFKDIHQLCSLMTIQSSSSLDQTTTSVAHCYYNDVQIKRKIVDGDTHCCHLRVLFVGVCGSPMPRKLLQSKTGDGAATATKIGSTSGEWRKWCYWNGFPQIYYIGCKFSSQ